MGSRKRSRRSRTAGPRRSSAPPIWTRRSSTGSFMCREALKGYLADATQIDSEHVDAFVDKHETPFGINEAKQLAKALDDVRAVDPACGSGAYLLGLLHEIVALYRLLYSDKL